MAFSAFSFKTLSGMLYLNTDIFCDACKCKDREVLYLFLVELSVKQLTILITMMAMESLFNNRDSTFLQLFSEEKIQSGKRTHK